MADQSKTPRSRWLFPVVVVVIALLAITFVLLNTRGSSDEQATPSSSAPPARSEFEYRDPEDPMAVGPVDAPLGMVVFSDYQCEYCARWTTDTLPKLMPYVDSGKLRIEFRDMNIFGDASETAARAAYAAGLQGRLADYQAALFAGGRPRGPAKLTEQALIDLAAELKLDVPRFRADLTSGAVLTAVRNKASDGTAAGTYTTPSFIIGNEPIVGAQATSVFTKTIDRLLGTDGD